MHLDIWTVNIYNFPLLVNVPWFPLTQSYKAIFFVDLYVTTWQFLGYNWLFFRYTYNTKMKWYCMTFKLTWGTDTQIMIQSNDMNNKQVK